MDKDSRSQPQKWQKLFMHIVHKYQWIYLLAICALLIISLHAATYQGNRRRRPEIVAAGLKCFGVGRRIQENVTILEDIMLAAKRPQAGTNIFFHETSCSDGIVKLNARQACAIESAAKTNANWDVFVMFASPAGFRTDTPKAPILAALDQYPNIHWRNVNVWSYARNTPAESWMNKSALFESIYLQEHTADFLRLLSLFKFGGTHVDLDFIMKKSLINMTHNYAGTESENYLANGLMNFDHRGIGHDMAEKCISEFVAHFDGSVWAGNGPVLLTRIVNQFCPHFKCGTYTALPKNELYAVNFNKWHWLFEKEYTAEVMALTQNSTAVHFWNKISVGRPVVVGSNVAYGLLAAEHCPKVYASCGDIF